jgi:hypothetical protein
LVVRGLLDRIVALGLKLSHLILCLGEVPFVLLCGALSIKQFVLARRRRLLECGNLTV